MVNISKPVHFFLTNPPGETGTSKSLAVTVRGGHKWEELLHMAHRAAVKSSWFCGPTRGVSLAPVPPLSTQLLLVPVLSTGTYSLTFLSGFPPAGFLKQLSCLRLLQQVLSAVMHLMGKRSTIGTLIRQQHVPPEKPNAPGNCRVTLRASVLCRTELPESMWVPWHAVRLA